MFSNLPFFPPRGSSMAGHVDALYFFLVALTAFFTTIISLAIVYFAVRYRKQRSPEATQVHGSTALELFWTGVPLAIVLGIFVWSAVIFFIPTFRIKADVLPGRYTSTWFRATTPGTYHLFCAEYCGTDHSAMIGSVVVMDPQDYARWAEGGVDGSLANAGEKTFQHYGCAMCHRTDAAGRAPNLMGSFGKQVLLDDGRTLTVDESYVRESILNPC